MLQEAEKDAARGRMEAFLVQVQESANDLTSAARAMDTQLREWIAAHNRLVAEANALDLELRSAGGETGVTLTTANVRTPWSSVLLDDLWAGVGEALAGIQRQDQERQRAEVAQAARERAAKEELDARMRGEKVVEIAPGHERTLVWNEQRQQWVRTDRKPT